MNLNLDYLPRATRDAFEFLSKQKWISEGWYLADGTALALQSEHRKSFDLDFFTQKPDFDNNELLKNFLNNKNWETDLNKKNTIYGKLFKSKVSFIAYPFFIPKEKFIEYGFIKILQPKDIAVMKIIAISRRGQKRDFFDLYWCAKNIEPLENILQKLKFQYPSVAHDYHHILKSLIYFDDADKDPAPQINFKVEWREVKSFFTKEIPYLTKKIINFN